MALGLTTDEWCTAEAVVLASACKVWRGKAVRGTSTVRVGETSTVDGSVSTGSSVGRLEVVVGEGVPFGVLAAVGL